jgi:hypothetical protein
MKTLVGRVLNKKAPGIPYVTSLEYFPERFRKFCGMLIVRVEKLRGDKIREFIHFGSCTYVEVEKINMGIPTKTTGIITAAHILNTEPPNSVKEISAIFLDSKGVKHKIIIARENYFSSVLLMDNSGDILMLRAPDRPNYLRPCKIMPVEHINDLKKHKLIAFGCPKGLLGVVWHLSKNSFTICDNEIISSEFCIFGVSGGGVFVEIGNRIFLVGIHTYGDDETGNLVSAIFLKE